MHDNIESHLKEKRVFKPPKEFAQKARIKSLDQYRRMYRESIKRPDKFWAREARELVWRAPWRKVVEWKAPFAKWFVGGKLNLSENCLDRHLTSPSPQQSSESSGKASRAKSARSPISNSTTKFAGSQMC